MRCRPITENGVPDLESPECMNLPLLSDASGAAGGGRGDRAAAV